MLNNVSNPVIVIFAPTACGKTALATQVFGKSSLSVFKGMGELISADSQAVYKGMNIGTAKPDLQTQKELPHHLIDLVSPEEQFGVGEFVIKADECVRQIHQGGKIPLVVGGTGFYIRNFLLGLTKAPESDETVRRKLKERIALEGNRALYEELKKIDAESASKINLHDEYRICRALEVYYTSGKPLSSYQVPQELRKEFTFCTIILTRERKELYQRIDERIEWMFQNGLVEEVERLKNQGFTKESPGLKAIGYSEFFEEGLSLEEIKSNIKFHSHRYAKRQYTYMRGIPGAVTIHADDSETFLKTITDFLEQQNFQLQES